MTMRRRIDERRGGFSCTEYLLVVTLVIAAVMAVRATFETRVRGVMEAAVNEIPTQ